MLLKIACGKPTDDQLKEILGDPIVFADQQMSFISNAGVRQVGCGLIIIFINFLLKFDKKNLFESCVFTTELN